MDSYFTDTFIEDKKFDNIIAQNMAVVQGFPGFSGGLFGDKTNSIEERISFEFTDDPVLLRQYYALREHCYRNDLGISSFSGNPNSYDASGDIIVAHDNGFVIGGARMNISSPHNRVFLPLEEEGFIMRDLFPSWNLEEKTYCEFSRFIVDEEYRSHGGVCKGILMFLSKVAIKSGCKYQFSVSTFSAARNYRMIFRKMGIQHEIFDSISVPIKPVYERLNGLGIYLSVTYLKDNLEDEVGGIGREILF